MVACYEVCGGREWDSIMFHVKSSYECGHDSQVRKILFGVRRQSKGVLLRSLQSTPSNVK